MIYFLTLSFILISLASLIILSPKIKRRGLNYLFMIISFCGLLIFSGLRGLNIGTDTFMYVRYFNNVNGLNDLSNYKERFEIGFRVFTCLIAEFFTNPQILLFLSTLITLLLFYILFYKISVVPWYSIILFISLMIFFNSMCLSRQYIAIALTCISMFLLANNRLLASIMLTICAVSFHSSAIIVFIMYFISNIEITKRKRLIMVLLVIIASMFFNKLVLLLIKIVPKYATYLVSDYYLQNQIGSILKMSVWGAMFIFQDYIYFKFYDEKNENIKWKRIQYYCSLIAFAISLVAIKGAILERMGLYFSVMNCISIPNSLNKIKPRKLKYFWAFVILICCIMYGVITTIFRPEWAGVFPYVFGWE